VNLSNQVLKIRYRLLKEKFSEGEKPNINYGENARLISRPLDELRPSIGQLNPDDAILVRTDEDKHKYRNIFNSTFIFTIEEAKGLEFETVFLLEFFKNRQSVWNKVFNSNQLLMGTDIPELRLELNLLYVAVTRARRILNIWETNPSVFWSEDELINFIQPIAPQEIRKNQIDQNFQMWVSRGIYYRDSEFYAQAIECFEKAGEQRLKLEVQVKLWLRERNYSQAAEGLVELKDWKQAAQVFEKLKKWNRAAECWSEAGNIANQKKSEAKQFEATLCWEEAALLWDELGFEEDAKRCRDKRIDISKSFDGVNEKKTLAREFEKTQYWEEAALLWDELGFEEDAKRC
jgi:tetratricopeptide (TPR) repeat protein